MARHDARGEAVARKGEPERLVLAWVFAPGDYEPQVLLAPTDVGLRGTILDSRSYNHEGTNSFTIRRFEAVPGDVPRVEVELEVTYGTINCWSPGGPQVAERRLVACNLEAAGPDCTSPIAYGWHLEGELGGELSIERTGTGYRFTRGRGTVPEAVRPLLAEHSFEELREVTSVAASCDMFDRPE